VAFDIQGLRRSVLEGERPLRVTTHAQVEAFKEGLQLPDLRHVFETGTVIEEYEEERALLYGWAVSVRLPVHLVIEAAPEEVVLITAYVPDSSQWIGYSRRRRRRKNEPG
jgi:hypothetical protein